MTDRKDPADLARRFLDLWQDQVSAAARDPELAAAVQRWLNFWMTAGLAPDRTPSEPPINDPSQPGPAEPPRSPTAAATSGHGGPDVDELARRVRELEERLASLESSQVDPVFAGRRGSPRRARRFDRGKPADRD